MLRARPAPPPPTEPTGIEGAGPRPLSRRLLDGPAARALLVTGLRTLPRPLRDATLPWWARLFHLVARHARHTVDENLRVVLAGASADEVRACSRRLFENYARSLVHRYTLQLGEPLPVVPRLEGREHYEAAMAEGRGVILATGHLGYWSLAPFVMEHLGFPAPVIAMAPEAHAEVQAREDVLRRRHRVVYTTASPFAPIDLLRALSAGRAVALQIDRVVSDRAERLPFLGAPAWFPLGPAVLARISHAPIIPCLMIAEGERGFRAVLEPAVRVEHRRDRDAALSEATAKLVEVYARWVRRFPDQWFTFHDFWADLRDGGGGEAR